MVEVAFLTLLERKVLGYIHIRKGPNRVGFIGVLQPFSDAIRLSSREQRRMGTVSGGVRTLTYVRLNSFQGREIYCVIAKTVTFLLS
jgi:NADH:ubiquinone oxidoreductase subunit H